MSSAGRLVNAIEGAGKEVLFLRMPDGSGTLVLPHGGRVLGLFSASCEENFFWTSPLLDSAETARAFFESTDWHNSGGDRTWIAPEVDVFFPDYPDLTRYWQPRELDPGSYSVQMEDPWPRLTNRLSLVFSRTGQRVSMEIVKRIAPAPDPVQSDALEYAGYTLYTSLTLQAESACRLGLWNLLQLTHPGEFLVPTVSRPEVSVYFGMVEPDDLEISEHLLRYQACKPGGHKLGIGCAFLSGRAGYLYRDERGLCLVVRQFHVNPSGVYVDVPWREPNGPGTAFQACNVNSGIGRFNELEYHAPAIGGPDGPHSCDDTSVVWGFRGRADHVIEAACRLLSEDVTR